MYSDACRPSNGVYMKRKMLISEDEQMNTTMKTFAITVLGTTFGFGFSAQADLVIGDTIQLTLNSKSPGTDVGIRLGWSSFGSKAAKYNWSNGIETFCAQLTDTIDIGQTATFDVVEVGDIPNSSSTIGSARAVLINDLYARWYDYLDTEGWNDRRAAAFQIVLWEIRHETSDGETARDILNDLDLRHGHAEFYSSYWVDVTAKYLLDSLGGGDTFLTYDSLAGLVSSQAQDHIAIIPSTPVPGPLGLACGLGIMGLRRRRSRRA